MTSPAKANCCPRCGGHGRSVAALAAAETSHQRAAGRFAGSGVGAGAFGAGVGLGSGSYSEERTTRSERARLFAPPARIGLPFAVWPFGLALAALAAPEHVVSALAAFGVAAPDLPRLSTALLTVIIAGGGALVLWALFAAFEGHRALEADRNRSLPQRRARYAELRYCAGCHVVFDGQARAEPADREGVDRLLAADP